MREKLQFFDDMHSFKLTLHLSPSYERIKNVEIQTTSPSPLALASAKASPPSPSSQPVLQGNLTKKEKQKKTNKKINK
jgi:hypothetical protein